MNIYITEEERVERARLSKLSLKKRIAEFVLKTQGKKFMETTLLRVKQDWVMDYGWREISKNYTKRERLNSIINKLLSKEYKRAGL